MGSRLTALSHGTWATLVPLLLAPSDLWDPVQLSSSLQALSTFPILFTETILPLLLGSAQKQGAPLPTGTGARGQSAPSCPDHSTESPVCILSLPPTSQSLPTPEPCTRRQPGRGTASLRDDPAEGGPGRQPSAAGGLAPHSSVPTAHTPAGSGWTRQRGDSLSEKPGAREGTRHSEGFLQIRELVD